MDSPLIYCGTGGYTGPLPGDPDNNSTLTATPAFGGIDIEFTYPEHNAHALAHTILYRGTSDNFLYAVRHRVMTGNFFYDKIDAPNSIRYYYWIQHVTVHGTVLPVIGPASAIAKPTIESVMDMLSGEINEGLLAQSLRAQLDKITHLEDGIHQESQYRLENDQALAEAFTSLQASFDENVALVLQEINTRSTNDSALANYISTVQSQLGDNIATVQQTFETQIQTIGDTVTAIGARYTVQVGVNDLVGGFGVYNDGRTIEAGFDVNRFWIGSSQANKRKPFIIDGGIVYIDEAAINRLTFSKLRDESGSFIVQNGRIKADYITIGIAQVTSANIADGHITNAKIANGAITNAKIGDAQITRAKIGTAQIDRILLENGAATAAVTGDFGTINRWFAYNWVTDATVYIPLSEGGEILVFARIVSSGKGTGVSQPKGIVWRMLIGGSQVAYKELPVIYGGEWGNSIPPINEVWTGMGPGYVGNVPVQIQSMSYGAEHQDSYSLRLFVLSRHR